MLEKVLKAIDCCGKNTVQKWPVGSLEVSRFFWEPSSGRTSKAFERSLRQFESESGKQIDEEFLLGVIINGLTDQSLRDHVIRNAARLTTYSQVEAELLDIARTNRVIQQLPQPMDIGALPDKGAGKGKDKGKGGGKGKDKGKGGGKGNPGSSNQKLCFYCDKPGHTKAECRKRIADEKAAKEKDKPAPKGKAKAKAKQGSGRRPTAAAPEDEEPVLANSDHSGWNCCCVD